jgi:hypothetical protein
LKGNVPLNGNYSHSILRIKILATYIYNLQSRNTKHVEYITHRIGDLL